MVDESAGVGNAHVNESDPSSACNDTEPSLSVPSSTPARGM